MVTKYRKSLYKGGRLDRFDCTGFSGRQSMTIIDKYPTYSCSALSFMKSSFVVSENSNNVYKIKISTE